MDNMLLRKVEELTLYVIELKKENEQQAKRLNNLEEKNISVNMKSNKCLNHDSEDD